MSRVGQEDPEALLDFLAGVKRSFWRAETHPASECNAGTDGAGADCGGGLEFDPELLLEFDEVLDAASLPS
jgi:hypothetical protein